MISHSHKFIFIHVCSTGGTSMKNVINPFIDITPKSAHYTVEEIFKIYGYDKLKEYFIFATVRNPWERMVSRYHYLKSVFPENTFSFNEWLKGSKFKYKGRIDKSDNLAKNQQQIDYLKFDSKLFCSFICRFETLDKDFKIVCSKLKLGNLKLPRLNSTPHRFFKNYYTNDLVKIVSELFKDDIEKFGYTF